MKPLAIGGLAALLIVAGISWVGFRAAIRAGEFTTLTPVFDGACVDVGGLPGAEDLWIDRAAGTVLVSSDDRRAAQAAARAGQAPPRGALVRLPLAGVESVSARVDLTGGVPARFHPHGLSVWTGPDGKRVVMVVNHPNGAPDYADTAVEIYDEAPDGRLIHRRSARVPGLVRINDIQATGPDGFYATSEFDPDRGGLAIGWGFLNGNDASGSLWHVEGGVGRKLADGLGFANSVALSPDGRTLYATATIARALHIFDRNPRTQALERRDVAFLGTGVDNLDVEPDGRVWIASHPKLLTFALGHAARGRPAPSQIIVVEPATDGPGGKVDQVYLKTGEPEDGAPGFSGASVAARTGDTMVLGSVFEPGIRVCRLPAVWKQSESHPAQRLLDTERDEIARERKEAEDAARKAAPAPAPASAPAPAPNP
jgi:arylesterase/paraoxonase